MTPEAICPSCSTALLPKEIKGLLVHLCNNCGNFLMAKDSFDGLVGVDIAKEEDEERSGIPCPGCGGDLRQSHVQGEEVHFCSSCNMVHTDHDSFSQISHSFGIEDVATQMDVTRNVENASNYHQVDTLKVQDVFILYRNGILISSYTTDVKTGLDKDVLGAMMMAITDFVRSCFTSMEGGPPLSSIKLGEKEIAFEHGEYLVMAVTLKGTLEPDIRQSISRAIKLVEEQHDEFLREWSGNLKEIKDLALSLQGLLVPVKL